MEKWVKVPILVSDDDENFCHEECPWNDTSLCCMLFSEDLNYEQRCLACAAAEVEK